MFWRRAVMRTNSSCASQSIFSFIASQDEPGRQGDPFALTPPPPGGLGVQCLAGEVQQRHVALPGAGLDRPEDQPPLDALDLRADLDRARLEVDVCPPQVDGLVAAQAWKMSSANAAYRDRAGPARGTAYRSRTAGRRRTRSMGINVPSITT